jgi:hypothetical protein
MNSAVGFCGSNAGRSCASACSAQYCGAPSALTQIEMLGRDKHPVSVLELACIDTIEPDGEGFAECRARFSGRADEIRDDRAASFNNPIAHPAHTACMFDTVLMAEPEIARQIGTHGVRVEHHCIEQRR